MINSKYFTQRLQKIIVYYNLTASSLADKIGVQRSSISHILSGRNKPSLDFVMKVLSSFPEVDLYWLLNGKGVFPKDSQSEPQNVDAETKLDSTISDALISETKDIDRIIVFFNDGTFKNYKN